MGADTHQLGTLWLHPLDKSWQEPSQGLGFRLQGEPQQHPGGTSKLGAPCLVPSTWRPPQSQHPPAQGSLQALGCCLTAPPYLAPHCLCYLWMVSSSSLVFTSSSCICFFMASSSSEAEAGAPSRSHLSRRALDWGAEGGHGPALPSRGGSLGFPGHPHLEMLQLPPVILQLPPFVLDLRLTLPLLLGGRERGWGRPGEGSCTGHGRAGGSGAAPGTGLWGPASGTPHSKAGVQSLPAPGQTEALRV